jgi:hypothetical protein
MTVIDGQSRLDTINEAIEIDEINVPECNFHSLSGFNPVRYSIHVNGPWYITFEFKGVTPSTSISNSTTECKYQNGASLLTNVESLMAEYKAKRDPDRCPSHPGRFLMTSCLR